MDSIRLLFASGLFISVFESGSAQSFSVLHYSETSGYNHQTRNVSFAMLQQLGLQHNFTADDDSTGDFFNSLAALQQYEAIVFANTTGNAILDSLQRSNFEQYISNGGNLIGIHSATDTYRHSSADGNNTGTWDFFPELLGGSVQQNPTHVAGTPVYSMYALQQHPLLAGIPDPWQKPEEYYYWENGYFDSVNNSVLLMVDTTISPDSLVHSYDLPRPTAWYKVTPGGNRIFYTSLGHASSNYTGDTLFINLIRNALLWVSGTSHTMEFSSRGDVVYCYPNPASTHFTIRLSEKIQSRWLSGAHVEIYNMTGEIIFQADCRELLAVNCEPFRPGLYYIAIQTKDLQFAKKIAIVHD